jgi:hypothetical protein
MIQWFRGTGRSQMVRSFCSWWGCDWSLPIQVAWELQYLLTGTVAGELQYLLTGTVAGELQYLLTGTVAGAAWLRQCSHGYVPTCLLIHHNYDNRYKYQIEPRILIFTRQSSSPHYCITSPSTMQDKSHIWSPLEWVDVGTRPKVRWIYSIVHVS